MAGGVIKFASVSRRLAQDCHDSGDEMVKNVDLDDFRAIRRVLEPDDFVVTDGKPDPPSTDLIDQEAWDHITTLPGHVVITTTSYQGSKIACCTSYL
jgi:hypothetical protein